MRIGSPKTTILRNKFTLGGSNKSNKRVSFHPYTQVVNYWPVVDPAIKRELYYTENDLRSMRVEAKVTLSRWMGQKKMQIQMIQEQDPLLCLNNWHDKQEEEEYQTIRHDSSNFTSSSAMDMEQTSCDEPFFFYEEGECQSIRHDSSNFTSPPTADKQQTYRGEPFFFY
mmetsp:Transcript_37188/g.42445  ORF Transcript_37188/g.42445 Transcript_37188/m.42445 type:complete len:169 (+) Transcript_37188:108-614(+)